MNIQARNCTQILYFLLRLNTTHLASLPCNSFSLSWSELFKSIICWVFYKTDQHSYHNQTYCRNFQSLRAKHWINSKFRLDIDSPISSWILKTISLSQTQARKCLQKAFSPCLLRSVSWTVFNKHITDKTLHISNFMCTS